MGRFTTGDTHAAPWQPLPGGLGGAADPRMTAMHALEADGIVQDLPGGPELTLTVTSPAGLATDQDLQELADGWAAMLSGLATHAADPESGGHTPSDFPLITLDQNEIEELENNLAERGGW
jgi:non-ribosomal peptide synthase protein (TIGR01720 family)